MKWNYNHFTGVDYDAKTETTAIYKVCFSLSEVADDRSKVMVKIGPTMSTTRTVRVPRALSLY
jgi:hypothetical protein